MKELSIEQKAKAYDEAIHRASGFRTQECKDVAEYIFPELAESEDERTWIINYLSNRELNSSIIAEKENLKKAIAWLEKQGEQNPVDKIQLGKKYKCIASPRYSTFRIGEIYKPEDKFLCSLMNFCSDCFEPIEDEQKPAYTKEYDFYGIKFIPKFAKGDIIKDEKCGEISTIEDFSCDTGLYTHTYGQFPITIQDNYEIIEQKPWSKEDEKIIRRIDSLLYSQCKIHGSEYEEIHNWLKSLTPQPKQEWSEEDGENLKWFEKFFRAESVIAEGKDIPQDRYLWFKNLKDRVQPKQEWGEEDERNLNDVILFIKTGTYSLDKEKLIDWLKSLRPYSQWKPSDEQMKALKRCCDGWSDNGDGILDSLYEQLKKLK